MKPRAYQKEFTIILQNIKPENNIVKKVNTTYIRLVTIAATRPARTKKVSTLRMEVMTIIPPLLLPGQMSIPPKSLPTNAEVRANAIIMISLT